MYRQRGLQGIYQGFTACLLFRSFFCVLWGSYEFYNQALRQTQIHNAWIPFLAGGFAANTFWTIAFPADVIKNRMMTQSLNNSSRKQNYRNIYECARIIWKTDGLRGFYRGFLPCFFRSFPTNGAAIFVYETFMKQGRKWVA